MQSPIGRINHGPKKEQHKNTVRSRHQVWIPPTLFEGYPLGGFQQIQTFLARGEPFVAKKN